MKTACPNCGGAVEFRFDDSFVRVCSFCRNAVLRTDRGVETLGKVADLVPIESPLKLFAEGRHGSATFLLVGMAQIRHSGGGVWQEWYAKLDAGSWGWLAEAQGRFYLTFAQAVEWLPERDALVPGAPVDLQINNVAKTFTVGEINTASYAGVVGEIPYRLEPNTEFHYADLSDGQGAFATIDYGEHGDPPTLYVGRQVTLAELQLSGGELGPSRAQPIKATRLACPNCNAPVDILVPGASLSAVCAHCNTLLDVTTGTLAILGKLSMRASPPIPLGSKGTFADGELTVIGFVQRSALVDGDWWPFDEYLLYEPTLGFRWLVCSDGHWSYVQPVATGAVAVDTKGCHYDGVRFREFQSAPLRVDQVLGEFYWKIAVGETVESEDFVAPPAMLSRETSSSEENWSLSTYLKVRDVQRAFGNRDLPIGSPTGVGPNQPDPIAGASTAMTFGFVALVVLGIAFSMIATDERKYAHDLIVPAAGTIAPVPDPVLPMPSDGTTPPETPPLGAPMPLPAAPNASNVFFSEPFQLDGGRNIEVTFVAALSNNWAYVAADLVNEATGAVVSVDANMEAYSGYEDGESWSEGSPRAHAMIGPLAEGTYVLRLETQQGGATETPLSVKVRQNVFRGSYLALAFLVLGIPFLFVGLYTWSFERRRWSNSASGKAPIQPFSVLMLVLGGVFTAIWFLIKAAGSSNDDD